MNIKEETQSPSLEELKKRWEQMPFEGKLSREHLSGCACLLSTLFYTIKKCGNQSEKDWYNQQFEMFRGILKKQKYYPIYLYKFD